MKGTIMKNIAVIGIGRIGLCFALTLEKGGYSVLGCDVIEDYVNKINSKALFPQIKYFSHNLI